LRRPSLLVCEEQISMQGSKALRAEMRGLEGFSLASLRWRGRVVWSLLRSLRWHSGILRIAVVFVMDLSF
jgi:hypothetical protein